MMNFWVCQKVIWDTWCDAKLKLEPRSVSLAVSRIIVSQHLARNVSQHHLACSVPRSVSITVSLFSHRLTASSRSRRLVASRSHLLAASYRLQHLT
ncbi:hypothetical protein LDENG_00272330 [Lucifuga dentata]|nr:hypothetical protein LDENG_00272330 [Lucifuga dentata]